ncbi:MAG: hypothetical protein KJ646_06105 [Nanoarchaeota archaeon]|nr:hypothetical protein [Nanoarchaeota archaeon]MBU4117020.1 hypothetical protein [Nanoarchaeota archaeon]
MESNKISKQNMKELLSQEHVFRGTNNYYLRPNNIEEFYKGIRYNGGNIIFTYSNLKSAVIAGKNRVKNHEELKINKAVPILMAIKIKPYINAVQYGVEPNEYEIRTPVKWDDIIFINSLNKFNKFAKNEFFNSAAAKNRMKDYFIKNYLSMQKNAKWLPESHLISLIKERGYK